METFQITQMSAEDVSKVLEIESEGALSPWSFKGYIEELERTDSILLIASNKKIIAGFICARLITSEVGTGEAEILNIAVKQGYRNKGIGKKLLQNVFARAKMKAVGQIWLEVRESNEAAQKFYRANGFEIAGKRKNFYQNPCENATLMKAEL